MSYNEEYECEQRMEEAREYQRYTEEEAWQRAQEEYEYWFWNAPEAWLDRLLYEIDYECR